MKNKLYLLLAVCILCTACGPNQQNNSISSRESSREESSLAESRRELVESEQESEQSKQEFEESADVEEDIFELVENSTEDEISIPSSPSSPPTRSGTPATTSSAPIPSSTAPATSSTAPATSRSAPVVSSSTPAASSAAPTTFGNTPAASSNTASSKPAASKSGTPQTLSGTEYLDSVEREVIRLINAERSALGLGQLQYDYNLTQAARVRSRELYQNNYFAHTRPNGEGWQSVLQVEVPVRYVTAGENLAKVEHNMPDYDPAYDANYWYTTWENSPGHYQNMVKPGFTHVGLGIYYRVKNGLVVALATTVFASYA